MAVRRVAVETGRLGGGRAVTSARNGLRSSLSLRSERWGFATRLLFGLFPLAMAQFQVFSRR